MKYIKLLLLALLIPQITLGAVAVGWNATSTASNLLYPNYVNGVLKVPSANEFRANFFTGGFFTATSTTATSTITNALQIGSTAGSNQLKMTASQNYPASDSVGGQVNITGTNNLGSLLTLYSNAGVGRLNDVLRIKIDNALNDQRGLSISNDGTRSAALFDCTNATRVSGGECVTITDVAGANRTTFGVSGAPIGLGLLKFVVNSGADANASGLSLQIDDTDPQGIFVDTVAGYTGKFLNFRNSGNELLTMLSGGNLGIGTSSPYAKLAVVGDVVATNFYATSTTASSTFANGINLTGGCFSINGSCITSGGGVSSGASTTLLADSNTFSGLNTFTNTGTTTFAGNVGIGTSSPSYGKYNSGLTLGLNKNIVLTTDRNTNNFVGNLIFKNESASTTKSGLEWYGYLNPTVSRAWLVFHESLNGELDGSHGAPHLEIETSDVSGAKQGRWTVQADCDYDCIQTFNQSEVYITRNSGQTNGNLLFNGGGQLRNTGVMQIIPNNALNTKGFRVATSTDNDIMIDVTSGTELEIQDTINLTGSQFISGNLGIGTTSPANQITIEKSGSSGTTIGPTLELRQNQTSINTTTNSNIGEILFSGADIFPNETGIGAKIRGEASNVWNGTTNDYPTSLLFFTNPNGSEALREVMRATDTGFVGIGTTSPYAKLSVVGEVVASHFTGTTTATSTLKGGIEGTYLNLTGASTATSTSSNGLNLTSGCFSINGTCITGGSGGSTASTTLLADVNTFSTSATTTFLGKIDANRLTSATLRITGLTNCNSSLTLKTDLYGNVICETDQTGAGGAVTGNGIAGMMASWSSGSNLIATSTIIGNQIIATSTTATSTIAGALAIGGATQDATFSVKGIGGKVAQFFTSAGTKLMDIANDGIVTLLGVWNFGDATSLEIPNSDTPTYGARGILSLDTNANNLTIATSTLGHQVVWSATTTLYSFSMASTSPYFVNGATKMLPSKSLQQVITTIWCKVDGGTSKVINLSDGTNDTNSVTCTTTGSEYPITTNATFTPAETINLEMGATSGTVNDLIIDIKGYRVSN